MYDNAENMHQYIFDKADFLEINPAKLFLTEYKLPIGSKSAWWKPETQSDAEDVFVANINLMAGIDNTLSRFVTSLAESVQFPKSTAFLHGLGIVSAAMTENFFYSFNGRHDNTCSLYTVGAQPPSTGKSAIDAYLTSPIHAAYEKKKGTNKEERAKLELKIKRIEGKIKKAGDKEAEQMAVDLIALGDELNKYPIYEWCINDPTPEGCEKVLAGQNGFYNVVSDESAAITVILGMVYGDGARNNGVFLKAWDNGYLSVARAGREGYSGNIRGSVAVLAQDLSIESILTAGQGGEGISERFLILREPNLLGERNHTKYEPVSPIYTKDYEETINRIVETRWDVKLALSADAEQMVRAIKQDQEPLMADGGKYSTPMLRGVVGKNEKQIIKIACVLHVIKEWSADGTQSKEVGTDSVFSASMIFNQLLKTYVAAADSKGFTGEKTEINTIIECLKRSAGKNKLKTNIRNLRDLIKNTKQFKSMDNLTGRIRDDYIPQLENMAYIVHDETNDEIHINPYLKE
tara:strand:+ start:754 stop:2313 length:1560 start_codon:yes stop_codon:yes gene_type:complete